MTNPNYYHQHQKQEDATRATTPILADKANNCQSENLKAGYSEVAASPVQSTAPNSASSSPLSFHATSSIRNNNKIMATANDNHHRHPDVEHHCYNSNPQNTTSYGHNDAFSRGPLSPQSAPPTTSLSGDVTSASSSTTPVPSVIHTEPGMDGEATLSKTRTHGSTPYFPSINKSSSGNMSTGSISGSSNIIGKRGTTKVTGKKKHQTSKSKSGSNTSITQATSSPRPHDAGTGTSVTTNGQKKQRRLERNRLSAQLSRRRRKQYLEELEDRVVRLSLDMDSGRRAHAFQAINRITEIRQQVLASAEAVVQDLEFSSASTGVDNNNSTMMLEFQLDNYLRLLDGSGPLSRTESKELLILNSFLGQQLKSFSLPSHAKFILWLSLQGDVYYRGGRAASERLSAARIGERMLANGNDKVTPTNAMWPLVCNEVGLSYELEERLRLYQRSTILQEKSTWLDRHTARSSSLVMQSFHDCVGGMTRAVGDREIAMTKGILTPSQRVKYLAWAGKNSKRIQARLQARRHQHREDMKMNIAQTDDNDIHIGTYVDPTYQLNKSHHLAANLYILNHQLLRILKDFPYRPPPILTPPVLKKLMRRASFESLGQQKDADSRSIDSSTSSSSIKSLASSGSLMKSASNMSLGISAGLGSNDSERPATLNQITPQAGEQAAVELVDHALGFVKPIIPPTPKPLNKVMPTVYASASVGLNTNTRVVVPQDTASSMALDYHGQHIAPAPVTSYGTPTVLAPAPSNHHVVPAPQYEGISVHHLPNHPPAQLEKHNYSASHSQAHPSSQLQHINRPYQQPQVEHYYPPQQHIHYPPTSNAPLHSQQMMSLEHEPIVPVYQSSSPAVQHEQQRTQAAKRQHERKSSFLPPGLNVVPEDLFPGVEGTAADFIAIQDCLMDTEDWGIGIGLDMDTTT